MKHLEHLDLFSGIGGFALWMMGYPTDWLDLEDGEMPLSKAQEMRLSRKSLIK